MKIDGLHHLDNKAIDEFTQLYYKEYGIKLNKQEATELGNRFIRFMRAIYADALPKSKRVDK